MATLFQTGNFFLDHLTRRGQFTNWRLCFDEMTGDEPVTFAIEFVIEDCENGTRPVILDDNSMRAFRMLSLSNANEDGKLKETIRGFMIRQDIRELLFADWSNWGLRKTIDVKA